jgi:hypothetical protein
MRAAPRSGRRSRFTLPVTLEEVKHDMADFKAYMSVEITPRQWIPRDGSED